jgi:hypothetical protein
MRTRTTAEIDWDRRYLATLPGTPDRAALDREKSRREQKAATAVPAPSAPAARRPVIRPESPGGKAARRPVVDASTRHLLDGLPPAERAEAIREIRSLPRVEHRTFGFQLRP